MQESKVQSSLSSIQTKSVWAWILLNTLQLVSSTQTWRNSTHHFHWMKKTTYQSEAYMGG
jgi:hypothetical protein